MITTINTASVLNVNQLCKPFLYNSDQEDIVLKFMEAVISSDDRNILFKKNFSNNKTMAAAASHILKQEFFKF